KILGIGLVGLTQFILCILLASVLVGVASAGIMGSEGVQAQVASQQLAIGSGAAGVSASEMGVVGKVTTELGKVDFQVIIITFLLYFFGGYLLYIALFAAVGAVVDSETDTQEFMFPITLPIVITYILL